MRILMLCAVFGACPSEPKSPPDEGRVVASPISSTEGEDGRAPVTETPAPSSPSGAPSPASSLSPAPDVLEAGVSACPSSAPASGALCKPVGAVCVFDQKPREGPTQITCTCARNNPPHANPLVGAWSCRSTGLLRRD